MADASYTAELEGYGNNFLEAFGKLLLEQCMVDLTLVSDSQSIKIHKCVLIASSSYFKERLVDTQENVIVFKTNFTVLMALVEFIYYGKTAYTESDSKALISAARLFNIKGLSSINSEDALPDFPPPVFITELSCSGDAVHKGIPEPVEEIGLNVASEKNESPKYYARFPIMLNDKPAPDDGHPHSLKRKRGRPRRNANIVKLNNSIKEAIEQEAKKSLESFELLKAIQAKNKNMDEGLQMAIDSIQIPENAVDKISDPYFDRETGNKMWSELDILENLEIPEDFSVNSENNACNGEEFLMNAFNVGKQEVPNAVPILFEYSDGSFVNISNEMCLNIAEDIECKMEEADIMEINQSDEFAEVTNEREQKNITA